MPQFVQPEPVVAYCHPSEPNLPRTLSASGVLYRHPNGSLFVLHRIEGEWCINFVDGPYDMSQSGPYAEEWLHPSKRCQFEGFAYWSPTESTYRKVL